MFWNYYIIWSRKSNSFCLLEDDEYFHADENDTATTQDYLGYILTKKDWCVELWTAIAL